jgi:hypothetical protein
MRFTRFSGVAFIVSAVLFAAQVGFALPLLKPPVADAEWVPWLQEWRFSISMADELLFFAPLSLIPGIACLYRVLRKVDQNKALLGCGIWAASIPVYLVMAILLGRLVYPVYAIELSLESYKLLLSLYSGGMHLIALLLGAAAIVLGFAIRKSQLGPSVAYLGWLAGALAIVGSYPWLIGAGATVAIQLLFSAWLALLGVRLLGTRWDAEMIENTEDARE